MRNLIALAFVLVSFIVSGCFSSHGRPDFVAPMVDDTNPFIGGDAGPTEPDSGRAELDAGPTEPDLGPIEADAGSDAFVPMEDAGTDASPIIEPDAGRVWSLSIGAFDMRPSAILIADTGNWEQIASVRVGPDQTFISMEVMLDGDAADISAVAIAADGLTLSRNTFPSGIGTSTNIEFVEPFTTGHDEYRRMDVWVQIPRVQSSLETGGADIGACNSGDTFRVGVTGVDSYIGSARTRTSFEPIMGNEFVIRKSRPFITRQGLPTATIRNGAEQDLYRFQVTAETTGPIAMKRFLMLINIPGSGMVCNLRLRRGSVEMSSSDYVINNGDTTTCYFGGSSVTVNFTNEETMSGSGNVYTLVGTPQGFAADGSFTVSFGPSDPVVRTEYLYRAGGPIISDLIGDCLTWSDLSEVPHSAALGTSGGSRDWTNGYLIDDLTQVQILTR